LRLAGGQPLPKASEHDTGIATRVFQVQPLLSRQRGSQFGARK
jgi:hypothetical protein